MIENFIKEMSEFYGVSLEADFKKFTYGEKTIFNNKFLSSKKIHQKLTIQEMEKFLWFFNCSRITEDHNPLKIV